MGTFFERKICLRKETREHPIELGCGLAYFTEELRLVCGGATGIDISNLDEVTGFWSDTIEIGNWGQFSKREYNGGARTFFAGKIK